MKEKVTICFVLGVLLLGANLLPNVQEWFAVRGILSERVSFKEADRFADKLAYAEYIKTGVEEVVGKDSAVNPLLYHYQGWVHRDDIDTASLPRAPGVLPEGEHYRLSVLVLRVRWFQTLLWRWELDVAATRTLLVDPAWMGSSYSSPPADHFDFVDEPWLLLETTF